MRNKLRVKVGVAAGVALLAGESDTPSFSWVSKLQYTPILNNEAPTIRVSGVCQRLRDAGQPLRGDHLHGELRLVRNTDL